VQRRFRYGGAEVQRFNLEMLKRFRGVQRSCRGLAQVQVHLLWAVVQSCRRCRFRYGGAAEVLKRCKGKGGAEGRCRGAGVQVMHKRC